MFHLYLFEYVEEERLLTEGERLMQSEPCGVVAAWPGYVSSLCEPPLVTALHSGPSGPTEQY